ncbi:hypothetical protein ACFFNY_14130 [Paenibacillus hodogayensis]|uniref:Uncharacterized protein n=1 Tax=Paenibacillus hodogayensis TaxID=279208 RepID=A0ABV5VWK2_9BACL
MEESGQAVHLEGVNMKKPEWGTMSFRLDGVGEEGDIEADTKHGGA